MKNIKTLVITSLVFALLFVGYQYSQQQKQALASLALSVTDGPYIFNKAEQLDAVWLCNGEVERELFSNSQLPLTLSYCDLNATVHTISPDNSQILEYSGDFELAAISDFHGQYQLMFQILNNNQIIDSQGRWAFSDGHLVITGDVFDRGDKVTEILWFLYQLEREAEQASGKVHLLLGNHEVMILNGDLRYLHPKYVETAKAIGLPFEQLFAKGTILGDWLRTKPVLVKINNMLFTHGGFHPSLAKEQRTLAEINTVFKQNLVKAELETERSDWANFLHKTNGPIWYRGYFKDDGASSGEIDLLLSHFDVEHLVVGHTSQENVETRHQGRVIAIDSSIKKGQKGEILLVNSKGLIRGDHLGQQTSLNIH